ncbi:MAG: DUF6029 family protein [Bacteroidales bacterium]|nr:DUF6029 family protein [Bacteroidales bacterium]
MSFLRQRNKISIPILLLVVVSSGYSQFRGNNLLEYQLGNIPEKDPTDLSTLYSQSNLFYSYKKLDLQLRLEQFYSSDSGAFNYIIPSQYRITYTDTSLKIQAGTIYETFGRGLLFRTYEIKNTILEDRVYRQRKGFYRDLQGFAVDYNYKWFAIKALRGTVSNNLFPINSENYRTDLVEGMEPSVELYNQRAGWILLRHTTPFQQDLYTSFYWDGYLPFGLSIYAEYASLLKDTDNLINQSLTDSVSGIYIGANYAYKNFGVSVEFKDYKKIFLGSGISSPPTLIKEHTYRTLNRSTHVAEIIDESGYQIEFYYNTTKGNMITVNNSYAKNDLFTTFIFREYFAEIAINQFKKLKLKIFADYSTDELAFEKRRVTSGIYTDLLFPGNKLLTVETEIQHFTREIIQAVEIYNGYLGLYYKPSYKLSLGIQSELTTDPLIADKAKTAEIEPRRFYTGGQVLYRINMNNTLQLFVGQRRGGPACSNGVCYEVLDFEGIELRLNTKF